jgi:cobalt/nickel transport system permease protein
VSSIASTLRDLHSLDALATRVTALSGVDPRAKILATLAFILAVVSFDRYTVLALLPFALFPVAVGALGEVPARLIARKLLLASPFALMIGIFNPLLDRAALVDLFGVSLAGGWVSFTSILLRFTLTVAAALVLIATTGFDQVCTGLAQLGVPKIFTTQLLFLQRYADVLAGEAARMNAARELRSCGQRRLSLSVYGTLLGHLLLRSLERAQRIHLAMISRGFDGELRSLCRQGWRRADTVFLTGCVACFVLARGIDLPRTLGQWLAETVT